MADLLSVAAHRFAIWIGMATALFSADVRIQMDALQYTPAIQLAMTLLR
jgi:flagellar biosynthesis protein FliQ